MSPEERTASTETAPARSGASAPETGTLASKDGTKIFFRHVRPASGSARAQVLVVHGFAEHSGRYSHVLSRLAENGLDAWALDLRGHGRSEGGRGCIRVFQDYLDDVDALVAESGRRGIGTRFLLGHSMGGLVSTRFLQERGASGVRGLVLSSPFFRVKMPVPAVKRGAASVLSWIAPSVGLPAGLDPNGLSRDPEVVKAYVEDPLVFTTATSRWFTETMRAQARAFEDAPRFSLPALVMHGALDPLVDPEATHELFTRLGSVDKTLKLWTGLRHEVLNEPEREEVIALVLEWTLSHTTRGGMP